MENAPATNLEEIESRMLTLPQANCPVFHYFAPGLYVRELHMQAGTLAIGHKQKFPHLNILIKGKILMLESGGVQKEYAAPMTFMGMPGRKVGYVLEDIIWQNIYPTDETDIEKLEDFYVEKSDTWKEMTEKNKELFTSEFNTPIIFEVKL
jgi:hypothetical protein